MWKSASKSLQNFANSFFVQRHLATRAQSDGLNFAAGALDVVIDDGVIVTVVPQHFIARAIKAAPDFIFGILAPRTQPAFEILLRRRQNKNHDGGGQLLFYLLRTLHVNFQNQSLVEFPGLIEPLPGSTIPVLAENTRILKKLTAVDHLLECGFRYEIVTLATALRLAGGPCRARHRAQDVGKLQNLLHQGGFSGTRGAGDDQHQRVGLSHSMFCTCSRNFSISDFISRPRRVILRPSASLPGVFESRVFDSRCISCSRKSSFLPTSVAPARSDSNCCT